MGFLGGSAGKEPACQCKRGRFHPWVRKIPGRKKWQPTPVFLPGKSYEQRSLEGYSPWGPGESDTAEQLSKHSLVTGFRRVLESPQVWGSYRHRPWSVSSWAPLQLQDPCSPLLTPATTKLTNCRLYQPHWLRLKSFSPRCTARSCFLPVSFLACSREHPKNPLNTHQAGWRSAHSQDRPGPKPRSLRWCFLFAHDLPPWRVLRHISRCFSGGCTKLSISGDHLRNTPFCWLSLCPFFAPAPRSHS